MIANIPRTKRTEYRICKRMERNVGIAMANKAVCMRNRNPTEPERQTSLKPVDIKTKPSAANKSGREPRFGSSKIGGMGYFFEHCVSLHRYHRKSCRAKHLGIVSGNAACPTAMCCHSGTKTCGLRRLDTHQPRPINDITKAIIAKRQRVIGGQYGNCAIRIL